jgi:hypothetical protein
LNCCGKVAEWFGMAVEVVQWLLTVCYVMSSFEKKSNQQLICNDKWFILLC